MRRASNWLDARDSDRVTRWLPWLVAIAILALLVDQISMAEIIRSLEGARLELFLPLVAGACGVWFLLESAVLRMLFGRFHSAGSEGALTPSEARAARGATYLLTPIHWNLGRAGLILHLSRTKSIPILDATSTLLFQQTVDAGLLAGCAALGLAWLPETPERSVLARSCVALFLGLAVASLALASPRPHWTWLNRLRNLSLLRTHRLARPSDFFALALLKSAYYAVFLAVYVFGTRAFGIELPLALVVAAFPIIQAIGSIPITPAGLGTQQAAMLFFFSGHGAESAILAFGLAFSIVQTAVRCLIGVFYVKGVIRPTRSPLSDRVAGQGIPPRSAYGVGSDFDRGKAVGTIPSEPLATHPEHR